MGRSKLLEVNRNPALHTANKVLKDFIPKMVCNAVDVAEAAHGVIEMKSDSSAQEVEWCRNTVDVDEE